MLLKNSAFDNEVSASLIETALKNRNTQATVPTQIHILLKPLFLAIINKINAIIVVNIPNDPITNESKVITTPKAATLDPGTPSFPRSPRLYDF